MGDHREDDGEEAEAAAGGAQRLDKWLWFARVIKTRTLAQGLVTEGRVRVNRERIAKPSHSLKVGDVVTVAVGAHVRVLEVLGPGARRGPPAEAQGLYRELTPPRERLGHRADAAATVAQRSPGAGRPTKRDRRALDRLQSDDC